MKNEITTLQVFDRMTRDNNNGIMMSNTVFDTYKVKQGGVIAFGVTESVGNDARTQVEFGLPGKYMLMCLAVDREQYETTKQKLVQEKNEQGFLPIETLTYEATGGRKFIGKNKYGCISTARISINGIRSDDASILPFTHWLPFL